MRISDWSSDVCSSELFQWRLGSHCRCRPVNGWSDLALAGCGLGFRTAFGFGGPTHLFPRPAGYLVSHRQGPYQYQVRLPFWCRGGADRSEEHTSELQSLMRISYAVFCLNKKITETKHTTHTLLKTS